jgi:hypothetical protein
LGFGEQLVFEVEKCFWVFAGVLVVHGVVGYSFTLSSICTHQFGGNDEYNDHTHRIMHKVSCFEYCCFSLSWLAIFIAPLGVLVSLIPVSAS